MIQAPINVYPNNNVIDIDGNGTVFTFQFYGDNLAWVTGEIINNDTNQIVSGYIIPGNKIPITKIKNGDTLSVEMFKATHECNNGENYKYRLNLYQLQDDIPLCDMKYSSGRIQHHTSDTNQLYLPKGLDNIKAPYTATGTDGVTRTIGVCKIIFTTKAFDGTVTKNTATIQSYDANTGIVLLSSRFSGAVEENIRYEIWRNYLTTPFYSFKCRKTPTINTNIVTAKFNAVRCFAQYVNDADSRNVCLRDYRWELDCGVSSPTIMSYHCNNVDTFREDRNDGKTLNYNFAVIPKENTYATLYVHTTEDKEIMRNDLRTNFTYPEDYSSMYTKYSGEYNGFSYTDGICIDQTNKRIKFNINFKAQPMNVDNIALYRKSADMKYYVLVDYASYSSIDHDIPNVILNDNTASSRVKYEYCITQKFSGGQTTVGLNSIVFNMWKDVEVKWCSYSLQALEQSSGVSSQIYHLRNYQIAETWNLYTDIDNLSNTYNEDVQVHNNAAGQPQISKMNKSYRSGQLSGCISQIEALTYGNNMFDNGVQVAVNWDKMFSEYNTFLLKSPKDETMIISVSNNRELTRNEDDNFITSKFEYVEVEKINNIIITRVGDLNE